MPTVGIVGVGLIGRAWSNVFARAGWDVRLYDADPEALAAVPERIRQSLEDLAGSGLVDDLGRDPCHQTGLVGHALFGDRVDDHRREHVIVVDDRQHTRQRTFEVELTNEPTVGSGTSPRAASVLSARRRLSMGHNLSLASRIQRPSWLRIRYGDALHGVGVILYW